MTLWSVDVSHLRMPLGPWSSCPPCDGSWPPGTEGGRWSSSCSWTPGGAMTSVTVEHTSCIAGVPAARIPRRIGDRSVLVGMQGGRELTDGRWMGGLEGPGGAEPGRVRSRRHGAHIEEHQGVVQTAQLCALAAVDAVVQDVEVEAGPVAGAGVAAEVELGDVEAVQHVVGAQVDARRLPGRHHHGR